MSSPTSTNSIAIAIEICNKIVFKVEVFSGVYPDEGTPMDLKSIWDEKVEAIATSLLEDYTLLEENQQKEVIGAVFPIALRMLAWIEFHVGTFNFTRDFCFEFLEPSLFTPNGIIDHQRVQTKLSETVLNNVQRFQLACFYCQCNAIPRLFSNLTAEEKKLFYNADIPDIISQPDIIKYWSYYTMGELDKLKGDHKIDQFRLKSAVTSGSQLAVTYCLERTRSKESCKLDIAVRVFRHRMLKELQADEGMDTDDWVIFRNKSFNATEENWVPDHFFVDIFYSTISGMTEEQKGDFWKQFANTKFPDLDSHILKKAYARLLDYFLFWPYQEMFPKFLTTSWPHLPADVFSFLLLKIVERIEPKRGQFCYGEEKFYDYRRLLIEAWRECPRMAQLFLLRTNAGNILKLIDSIYKLKTFSEIDRTNIRIILETAQPEEKYYYMMSDKGFSISLMLIESERTELFHELISICFSFPDKVHDYKLKVILLKALQMNCLEFIKNENWEKAEEVLRWSDFQLKEEDLLILKSMLICRTDGMKICLDFYKIDPDKADYLVNWCVPFAVDSFKRRLISSELGQEVCRSLCVMNPEKADDFICWCLPPEGRSNYKVYLIHQMKSICMCTKYALKDNTPELAEQFFRWCLPEEKIKEFKHFLGHYKMEVFPTYKSTYDDIENCPDENFPDALFDWTSGNPTFKWCFDSDPEEIKKFKQNFLTKSKRDIIYKCIETNNWKLADRFMSWLKLDKIDFRKIKHEQIYGDGETRDLFNELLRLDKNNPKFAESGGKQRTIERFIHWFLVDDMSTVGTFLRRLRRYSDDTAIQNIITKLTSSNNLETIKELLLTP